MLVQSIRLDFDPLEFLEILGVVRNDRRAEVLGHARDEDVRRQRLVILTRFSQFGGLQTIAIPIQRCVAV